MEPLAEVSVISAFFVHPPSPYNTAGQFFLVKNKNKNHPKLQFSALCKETSAHCLIHPSQSLVFCYYFFKKVKSIQWRKTLHNLLGPRFQHYERTGEQTLAVRPQFLNDL